MQRAGPLGHAPRPHPACLVLWGEWATASTKKSPLTRLQVAALKQGPIHNALSRSVADVSGYSCQLLASIISGLLAVSQCQVKSQVGEPRGDLWFPVTTCGSATSLLPCNESPRSKPQSRFAFSSPRRCSSAFIFLHPNRTIMSTVAAIESTIVALQAEVAAVCGAASALGLP